MQCVSKVFMIDLSIALNFMHCDDEPILLESMLSQIKWLQLSNFVVEVAVYSKALKKVSNRYDCVSSVHHNATLPLKSCLITSGAKIYLRFHRRIIIRSKPT